MSRLAIATAALAPLAQASPPAPPATGPGWGWIVILAALAVFLVAVLGGVATLRRR